MKRTIQKISRQRHLSSMADPAIAAPRPVPSRDAGDTLIEILIAITILGLSGVALLGAFASDLSGASTYKNVSTVETVLKNFSEDATFQIQYQKNPLFADCATLSGTATPTPTYVDYMGTPLTYKPPTGFTVTVTGVSYLLNNGSSFISPSVSPCTTTEPWPQLITATATGPQGASGTLSFVVANFSYESYVQPS